MILLKRWWSRILATLQPRRHDENFRTEVETHLQFMVEERIARGMSEEEARRQAQIRLCGTTQLLEAHREWREAGWLSAALRDWRQAQRSLQRDPRFLAIALAVVALGIGAGTAVFSVVRHSMFRPLPYQRSDRLVSIGMTLPWAGDQEFLFGRAYAELVDTRPAAFAEVTSTEGVGDCELDLDGVRKRLSCAKVEASFLRVLGMRPGAGHDFTEADDRPGAAPVVLLSHQLWRTAYGAQPSIVGRTVILDETPAVVAGVLPADFELPSGEPVELLVPQKLDMQRQRVANPGRPLRVIGRLSDNATLFSAAVAIRAMFAGNMPEHARKSVDFRIRSIRDLRFQNRKVVFGFLAGSAACLFLTTCANVGFLLLARRAARRKERELRMALGADSIALLRQSLAEALFIAAAGGVLGIGLAHVLLRLIVPFIPAGLREAGTIQIDGDALLFAAACVVLASLLFGLVPSLRNRTSYSLNANRSAGSTPWGGRMRQALIVSQIALCIALTGGAATLLRSLWQLRADSARFEQDRITTASFILSRSGYSSTESQTAFFQRLEERLGGMGLVHAVAISDSLPFSSSARSQPLVALQPTRGSADPVSGSGGVVLWRFVTPGYFDALRIRVRQGRVFAASDVTGGPVAVVNEALARRLFPEGSALGRTISASGSPGYQIVGVVEDVRNDAMDARVQPEYFVLRQPAARAVYQNQQPPHGWRRASLIVRSPLSESGVRSLIAAELKSLAPGMEVTVETMAERVEAVSERPRFQAATLIAFGLVTLLLAAAGVYGLVTFLVAERAQEFAVRLALGATGRQIRRLVFGFSFRWTVWGAVAGAMLGAVAARLLQNMSHEIVRSDAAGYAVAAAALALVCVLAALIPAIRAGLTDPAATLRQQ